MAKQEIERLLVGVSGSVAVLSLPSYLATLRADLAAEIRVIMTAAAASMLPPSTAMEPPSIPETSSHDTSSIHGFLALCRTVANN